MTTTEITLRGTTEYNPRFAPRDAKKGYVAKITGRVSGVLKYGREFFGESLSILEGDEGLYEVQTGLKKGGQSRTYHVVLSHPEHGLIISVDCEDALPQIAKRLDEGASIQDAVEVTDLRPSAKHEGRMVFTAISRSKSEAVKVAVGQTVDSAVTACWDAMCHLPKKEQQKVMRELKARISPSVAEIADTEEVSDADQPA